MSKTITTTITSTGPFEDVIDALEKLEPYNAESVLVTVTFTLRETPDVKIGGVAYNLPKSSPFGPFGTSYAGGF